MSWEKKANCKKAPHDTFFPRESDVRKIEKAKQYCKGCPVKQHCLQRALVNDDEGIYGGTTYSERQMMKAIQPSIVQDISASLNLPSSPYMDALQDRNSSRTTQPDVNIGYMPTLPSHLLPGKSLLEAM